MMLLMTKPTDYTMEEIEVGILEAAEMVSKVPGTETTEDFLMQMVKAFRKARLVLDDVEQAEVDDCYKLIDEGKFAEAKEKIDKLDIEYEPTIVGLKTTLALEKTN